MLQNDERVVCFATCPGGSNVSLMAYKAASMLEKEGFGKFIRLAGDRAKDLDQKRLEEASKYAKQWVLIEGCNKGCGKKIFDTAGIQPDEHLLITNLGIERENKIDYSKDELEKVLKAVKAILTN